MHMSKVGNFENDDGVYKTLLELTKAIPWKIDWASMKFSHIGPQIEALLGWSADSWVSVEDWAMRMHPDDRERVVNFCVTQSQAGIDHEADYRALTRQRLRLIRDVVHVVRNSQVEDEALVGFMFDIASADRGKAAEPAKGTGGAVLDRLTNIANRRSFNARFEAAWEQAQRKQQPFSSATLRCGLLQAVQRPVRPHPGRWLPDRYRPDAESGLGRPPGSGGALGGEEFIVLLPGANAEVAHKVAERCQRLIQKNPSCRAVAVQPARNRQHRCGHGGVPDEAALHTDFLNAVDQQLCAAKHHGRNRIEHVGRRRP